MTDEAAIASKSQSAHILDLAKELLDDIELGRLDAEKLLLKASRLARWAGSDEIKEWLQYELTGYNMVAPISLKYMGLTYRWSNVEQKTGYWGPLAQQEATILAQKAKLSAMRIPDTSGEWSNIAIGNVTTAMNQTTDLISRMSVIRSNVFALLHKFVSEIYYEREFGGLSETIFETYKRDVDKLISQHCGDVLQKIPFVMDRLSDTDSESVSQALNTCRRIIESFADSVFPPSDTPIEINGLSVKLDASKHQNRINAYVNARVTSLSRRQKIRQNLNNLYDRVSTGCIRMSAQKKHILSF